VLIFIGGMFVNLPGHKPHRPDQTQ
jgi:hypothetical protein